MNIEEIKELREKVEELRRDVAWLHGRLDEIEVLLGVSEKTGLLLHGLKEMAQAYGSLVEPGCPLPQIYMHPEDLEFYERWQTENSPYKHMVGYFKGSRIQEEKSCPEGSVILRRADRTISVKISFEERL